MAHRYLYGFGDRFIHASCLARYMELVVSMLDWMDELYLLFKNNDDYLYTNYTPAELHASQRGPWPLLND